MAEEFVNEEGFDTLLAAGIKPMNGLDFAILQAHHVLVNAKKKRLDEVITELYSTADQTALAGRVTAVEAKATQNATDIGTVRTLAEGKAAIDDSAKSTTAVYSSSKTEDLITAAKQAVKDDLLQGAGAAYDSLKELGDLIETNKESIDAVKALAAGHVKYDGAQTLTDAQKTQARTNIGAASEAALATKLNATVAKVGEIPEGGTDPDALNLDTITDEGEYFIAHASGRPAGVSAAYQNLFVSVRKSSTTLEMVVRGIENGAGRVFVRSGSVGEDGAVTWAGWNEVGSKQDLTPIQTLAQKGVDDAAAAKTAADNAASAATAAQTTASAASTKATEVETSLNNLKTAIGATDVDFAAVYRAARDAA